MHKPAGEFCGEGCLALASGALDDYIALLRQQALGFQQIPATTEEPVLRLRRQFAECEMLLLPENCFNRLCGHFADELWVLLLLKEDRDEPVFEVDVAGEGLAAVRVRFQRLLAREHRMADSLAAQQFPVKLCDEARRSFDQDAVAHRGNRGHAAFQQLAGNGCGGVLIRFRGLAGFQEEERDAVIAHDSRNFPCIDELAAAAFLFVLVSRVFEAQLAESVLTVVTPWPSK